jgi:uncharacterized protein (TIGR00251 family)
VTFAVRVVPRSSKSSIAGTRGDALLVRLTAPPVEGAANEALVTLLAGVFDRPKRDISIVSGHASRDKRVAVSGVCADEITARLSAILAARPASGRAPRRS